MNQNNALNTISPVDGRYFEKTKDLTYFFSESALIRYRVRVEVEYFIALVEFSLPQLSDFDKGLFSELRKIYENFSLEDAQKVKDTERVTNHDVKAVEYFVKDKMDILGIGKHKEYVHFGLTSQDINNTAIPLSLREAFSNVYRPTMFSVLELVQTKAREWENVSMLAKTHGQPASPTKLGKEFLVFLERLDHQFQLLDAVPFAAKFGGATGNFNAHHVAYPNKDWVEFANQFVNKKLGLQRSATTTQIEHYDYLATLFDGLKRVNTIFIDLCRDVWTYISMDYFKQKINKNEVGSSAMPHKVNPIDFENAEGNFGIANAIFEHLSAKLPISRLQRDLTDSTVLRNVGVPIAHTILGMKSMLKGMNKLVLNQDAIDRDLEANWAVVAEAIQTVLRREGFDKPYEALKDLTRTNSVINQKVMHKFIDGLAVTENVKEELKQITPFNYTGVNLFA